jgi:hypothetical protein
MIETTLTLNLTVYILAAMGLTLLGFLFSLIALANSIRTGDSSRLPYTLFAFFLTLYTIPIWLPVTGLSPSFLTSQPVKIADIFLFYPTLYCYALTFHFSLKTRKQIKSFIALTVPFIILTVFMLLSQLVKGSGIFINLINQLDWNALTIGFIGLFLLVRLIIAFCFHESGTAGGTASLFLYILPLLLTIILTDSLTGLQIKTFTLFCLPLLIVWEFIRLFTGGENKEKEETVKPVGELREQLWESQNKQKDLITLLTDREAELGDITTKAKKVSRSLLPSMIHHDGQWEVSTYFNPATKSEKKELFDFYYSYGRKISGISLFETPEEPDGALYGAFLKKEWYEGFNKNSSLASLYRRINSHLNEIFDESKLKGVALRLEKDKIEYTGFGNPPLYYLNGKMKKCATLIQDKADSINDIKSYSLPCCQGDSFLICNEAFLNKPAPVTGQSFSKKKLIETVESFRGKSTDMVRELIDARNKFMGKRDESDILIIYIKRKA